MSADLLHLEIASVELHSLSAVRTAPGVAALMVAARNGFGTGWLRARGDGNVLAWKAPGSASYGQDVACEADGEALLLDGDDATKFVRVQVWYDFLTAPGEYPVYIRERYNNGIAPDDVTAEEAAAGDVATYTITLRNTSAGEIAGVVAWVNSAAATTLSISANGSDWSRPETELAAVPLPPIPAASTGTLHVRRTIAAGAAYDPKALVHLHFCFAIL